MCEQIWVVEVPKISKQESVEAVKVLFQDCNSQRMCEIIGVIEVPKILSQDRVDAVEIVLQERISEKDVCVNWGC